MAISLGSAGIGATAALTGTALQLRHAQADRERAEQAAWRNRAGTIIGPLRGVLADMEPRAIAEGGGRSDKTLANIGRRWWRARDDLLVFAAASPLPQIAVAGQEAAAAVGRSWTSMNSLNSALHAEGEAERGGVGALLDRACSDHDAATASVDTLWRLAGEATARA